DRDRRAPGVGRPVEQGYVLLTGALERRGRVGAEPVTKAREIHLQTPEAILEGPQVQLPGPRAQGGGPGQVLGLDEVPLLLDEGIGVLREAAGGCVEQPLVAGRLLEEPL